MTFYFQKTRIGLLSGNVYGKVLLERVHKIPQLTAMGGRSFVPSEEELVEEAGGGRGKGDW